MNELYAQVEEMFLSQTKLGDIIMRMENQGYKRDDIISELKKVERKYLSDNSIYD